MLCLLHQDYTRTTEGSSLFCWHQLLGLLFAIIGDHVIVAFNFFF